MTNRFQVSKEGMQQGYWKVYDTWSGQTLRVVQIKSVAETIAEKFNKAGKPEGISGSSS